MNLKQLITESFNKEYAYRVKFAHNCGAVEMEQIEQCLSKYNFVSASSFKRTPIEENPSEFYRAKGVKFISEVSSTDVILKYPVNARILEVWLAVNLNLDHERVLAYGVKEPRRLAAEISAERLANDEDRSVTEEDAVLNNEDQAHYEAEQDGLDFNDSFFGEEYNAKFLDELQKIKDEKGADYFRTYPSKDELMGDNLRPTYDDLVNTPNMGKGAESQKQVSNNTQNLKGTV
jgi:hypothetical protein|tara:strand:- start:141 stop:839 length:699 start_codon:yes stop_codon:yes gene_type:complete